MTSIIDGNSTRKIKEAGMNIFQTGRKYTAKWWELEIRFSRPLNKSEVRRLQGITELEGFFGSDGFLGGNRNSWPSEKTSLAILEALRKLPEYRIRASFIGEFCDCPVDCFDQSKGSNADCCEAHLKLKEWINV